jgi:hypothetical protein
MKATQIRQRLHLFIDSIGDKKAEAIYTLLEEEIDTDSQRKKLILSEREKYLKGEGKSFSWDDVKKMATNKAKRNAL